MREPGGAIAAGLAGQWNEVKAYRSLTSASSACRCAAASMP
jgi:hypothetical protein